MGKPMYNFGNAVKEKARQQKQMEVRLKQDWMGHGAGNIIKVSASCANTLFQRDTAEKMEPENIENIREKLQDMVAKNLLKSSPAN